MSRTYGYELHLNRENRRREGADGNIVYSLSRTQQDDVSVHWVFATKNRRLKACKKVAHVYCLENASEPVRVIDETGKDISLYVCATSFKAGTFTSVFMLHRRVRMS